MKDIKTKLAYKISKRVVIIATSFGASAIVYKLLQGRVTPSSTIQKITVPLGATAISGVVAGAAARQMSEDLDSIVDYAVDVMNSDKWPK